MKITKVITSEEEVVSGYICDKCRREINYVFDCMALQEMLHISYISGYDSIFGDGSVVECDLCQKCMKELLGEYLRITKSNVMDWIGE